LKRLADSVQESAHMVIRDKVEVLYILKEESSHSIRIATSLGSKMPMYCTGVGKGILAFMDEDYMSVYYRYQKLKKRTKNTLTNKKKLNLELASIRKSFISIDNEEFADHLYCVATPIFDSNENPIGAISVSGLKDRMISKKNVIYDEVLESGKSITKEIGGEYPRIINNTNIGVENGI
jgi:DNA-binding IclR family transcriptional regulator